MRRRLILVALAVAAAFATWMSFRGRSETPPRDDGYVLLASSPGRSAEAVPSAMEGSAGSPAPSAPSATRRDRALRDAIRRKIYASFAASEPGTETPSPARSAAPPSGSPLSIPAAKKGTLDKAYIQSRVREDFVPLAKECYEALLERDPDAAGKLVLEFEIVGDESVGGIVETAEIGEETTFADEELRYCVRESMLSMSFEPPKNGGSVTVVYPFLLSPGDGG